MAAKPINAKNTDDGHTFGQDAADLISFHGASAVAQGAALTAALTTITPADAEGTPDYAIAAVTNSTAYGFASAQEAITVLYVIANLQTRVAELEARLTAKGVIASA